MLKMNYLDTKTKTFEEIMTGKSQKDSENETQPPSQSDTTKETNP